MLKGNDRGPDFMDDGSGSNLQDGPSWGLASSKGAEPPDDFHDCIGAGVEDEIVLQDGPPTGGPVASGGGEPYWDSEAPDVFSDNFESMAQGLQGFDCTVCRDVVASDDFTGKVKAERGTTDSEGFRANTVGGDPSEHLIDVGGVGIHDSPPTGRRKDGHGTLCPRSSGKSLAGEFRGTLVSCDALDTGGCSQAKGQNELPSAPQAGAVGPSGLPTCDAGIAATLGFEASSANSGDEAVELGRSLDGAPLDDESSGRTGALDEPVAGTAFTLGNVVSGIESCGAAWYATPRPGGLERSGRLVAGYY